MKVSQTANKIKKEIDGVIKALIENGICDDSNFCAIRGKARECEITFAGSEHISLAYDDIDYSVIYSEFESKRSFNMKLIDGALVQMLYRIKNNQLIQHRLAFYPSPLLRSFQNDPEAYIRDELFIDIISRRIVPLPLRFDYDCREGYFKEIEHPKSHLTLGDVEGCRIPVSGPVSPRWFTDFIVRNFYQTENHRFSDDLPKHELHFPKSITGNESELVHIQIPLEK